MFTGLRSCVVGPVTWKRSRVARTDGKSGPLHSLRVRGGAGAPLATALARICVEINQCVGCTFLGDDAAVLARSSGQKPDRCAKEQASLDGVEVDATIRTNAPRI